MALSSATLPRGCHLFRLIDIALLAIVGVNSVFSVLPMILGNDAYHLPDHFPLAMLSEESISATATATQ